MAASNEEILKKQTTAAATGAAATPADSAKTAQQAADANASAATATTPSTAPTATVGTETAAATTTGAITDAVQSASRENYLAALDQLMQERNGTASDALKYQIQMYEEQLKAQTAALDAEKAQNEAALEAEAERLAAEGYENRRQTEADSAKARANWNETANAYGLNSGTQGQAALSFANQLQSDLTALRNVEAQERAEVERQRLSLGQEYQAAIEQAQAENNLALIQLLYEQALKADSSGSSSGYAGYFGSSNSNGRTTKIQALTDSITGNPWQDINLLSEADQQMLAEERAASNMTLEQMDEWLYNRVYPTLVARQTATGDSFKNLIDKIKETTGRTEFDRFYEYEPTSSGNSSGNSDSGKSSGAGASTSTKSATGMTTTGGSWRSAYDAIM